MQPNYLKAFLAYFFRYARKANATIMRCHAEFPNICSQLTVAFSDRTIQRTQKLLTVIVKLTLN